LRRWQPEQKSALPVPNDKFLEYETAIHWGYQLHEWQAESQVNKAKAMAHYVHARMREGYEAEKTAKGKGKKGSGLSGLMSAFGI
jgi:hypothetical protein